MISPTMPGGSASRSASVGGGFMPGFAVVLIVDRYLSLPFNRRLVDPSSSTLAILVTLCRDRPLLRREPRAPASPSDPLIGAPASISAAIKR
jgi:hypothetical protein